MVGERDQQATGVPGRRRLTDAEIREARRRDPVLQERLRRAKAEMDQVMGRPHETVSADEIPSFVRDRL
jgi:hypothetical protein